MLRLLSLLSASLAAVSSKAIPRLDSRASCTISTYTDASSISSSCTTISIAAQTVPTGESLSLSGIKDGVTVQLTGDLTFGTGSYWDGNLLTIAGGDITFNGNGYTIDGNGAYYWDGEGTNGGHAKPKYTVVISHSGTFKNVKIKNVPGHAVKISDTGGALTVTGVDYDNSAGNAKNSAGTVLGHNTDGFDVSASDVTIKGCTVNNQDDCLAVNSGSNIVFSGNTCTGGHGISIGSIKSGDVVDTVTIESNKVIDNQQGLRIKTYDGATSASVKNIVFKDNTVTGAIDYGVMVIEDYTNSGETGSVSDGVPIENVSFTGTNTVTFGTTGKAIRAKVLCGTGKCTGTWNWSGLDVTGGNAGSDVGGAPITGFTFS